MAIKSKSAIGSVILVLGLLTSLVAAGGLVYMDMQNTGPERVVTVKVGAVPSPTTTAESDEVTPFDSLKPHEQELFISAVEEADGAFEEADTTLSAENTDLSFYEDTKVVEYGGAYYPVFVVQDEIVEPTTDFYIFLYLLAFMFCMILTFSAGLYPLGYLSAGILWVLSKTRFVEWNGVGTI